MSAVKRCKARLAVNAVEDIPQNQVPRNRRLLDAAPKARNMIARGKREARRPWLERFDRIEH